LRRGTVSCTLRASFSKSWGDGRRSVGAPKQQEGRRVVPFSKFIIIPVFIAVQAFILMLIAKFIPGGTDSVGGPGLATWITFQAWAMYFLAGCTPKMAVKVLIGYFGGILASIAIFELGDLLAGGMGGYWGYAIAVLIIVVPVISMEKVPWLDFIPGYFIGAGVFFGAMTLKAVEHTRAGYTSVAVPEMIACAIGLAFGWVTVTIRVKYEAKVGAGAAEGAEDAS